VDPLARLVIDHHGGITVAGIEGEVDLSNAQELEVAISSAVPNHAAGLVVDLSEIHYLDSAGVALLFNLARRVSRRQQRFAVVVPEEDPVREILVLSGAPEPLSLHESLAEALEAEGGRPKPCRHERR
jgi:anti-sigma B factor antagonist